MLSYHTVEPHTLELLKELSNQDFLSEARLVGGTALALQYGHRMSVDLDFFGNINVDNTDLKRQLKDIGKLSVIKESKNINIFLLDGIKVDFINYAYQWIDDAVQESPIVLASPKDIAAMKPNVSLFFIICNVVFFYKTNYWRICLRQQKSRHAFDCMPAVYEGEIVLISLLRLSNRLLRLPKG